MEKLSFGYSLKNIPIPSERSYKLQLMEKTEMVIKRMRWKAIFSETDENDRNAKTYGLKTSKCPPQVKELSNFENDLLDLVKNVEFDDNFSRSQFQKDLQKHIGKITTLTAADKTSNMYRLTKEEHDKLVNNAITSTYKKLRKESRKR